MGTQGVPANYGGFETLVENIIGENDCPEIAYTVFCSSKDYTARLEKYKGAVLKYIPLHANGMQSIPYDVWSMLKTLKGYDIVLVLGVSGGIFLPIYRLLYKKKLIVNIDGLEYRRAKWGRLAKWLLRTSEAMAVRYADVVVADNKGIQDYVSERYGKQSELITYGGDHVLRKVAAGRQLEILRQYGVKDGEYVMSVCRIEPENNGALIMDACVKAQIPLIFIGNWSGSEYGRRLKEAYGQYGNVCMLDAVYDLDVLYALRAHCRYYVHGHSAGGTNPSLVEAMFFGKPIFAFDVVYNRETTEQKAFYFKTVDDLANLLSGHGGEGCGNALEKVAWEKYRWKLIARQYANLY